MLKLYNNAKENRDRIYAAIDAISLVQNSDRDKSPESIKQACKQAFEATGISPQDIGYLEVFASGIPQEDRAEIEGILQAYSDGSKLRYG